MKIATIVIACAIIGALAGVIAGYVIAKSSAPPPQGYIQRLDGFYSDSPDGGKRVEIYSKEIGISPGQKYRYTDVVLGAGSAVTIISYAHDAPENYFRRADNVIRWSSDSGSFSARYHDIIAGRHVVVEIEYDAKLQHVQFATKAEPDPITRVFQDMKEAKQIDEQKKTSTGAGTFDAE